MNRTLSWGRRPLKRVRSLCAACALGIGLMLAPGCESETTKRMGEQGSIFAAFSLPTPAEAARFAVDPYDANKRIVGLALLSNAPFGGDEVYLKVYRMALGAPPAEKPDSDAGVQAVAARALSLHGTGEDALLVLPLLENSDRRVRTDAVRSLQRLHNPKAIDGLIKRSSALTEEDVDARAESVTALAQYAEPRVLQALLAALSDDSLVVNRAATYSLTTLTGQTLGDDPRAWLDWLSKTRAPFEKRRQYVYPHFERDRFWYEYIPFIPPPPNEQPGIPAGMNPASSPPPG
jgi:hypothetical protein